MSDISATRIFGEEWTQAEFAIFMRPFISEMFRVHGSKVLAGPFKGMEIPSETHWDSWAQGAKLLGLYETELHGVIEKAIERKPKTILNVGCAEGYYAIGLARRLPDAKIIAVDISYEGLALCHEGSEKNGTYVTTATPTYSIDTFMDLTVMDCEGDEFDLLKNRFYDKSDLIVEVHPWTGKGTVNELTDRFAATHLMQFINPNPRMLFELWCRWPGNINQSCMLLDQRPPGAGWLVGWANDRSTD